MFWNMFWDVLTCVTLPPPFPHPPTSSALDHLTSPPSLPPSPPPPPHVKTQEDANAALQPVQLSGDDFRETRTLLVGLQEQQQEVDLEEEMMEQE